MSSLQELVVRQGRPTALPWEDLRRAAARRFLAAGLPDTRTEEWRFTSLAPLRSATFEVAPPPAVSGSSRIDTPEPLAGAVVIDVIDGYPRVPTSRLPPGLEVCSMRSRDFGGGQIGRTADLDHGLIALNSALFEDGVVVRIGRGVTLDRPLHLRMISQGGDEPLLCSPRVLVLAGPRSAALLVETYAAPEGNMILTNAVTEIRLEEGSVLEHVRLQDDARTDHHVGGLAVWQYRDSRYLSREITLGASLCRIDLRVVLDGPGAECSLEGLYLASGRQHVDHHTIVDHRQPNGTSLERYRGVVDGEASAVFDGRIVVRRDAQKTSAHQENRNLVLSDGARVNTRPSLQIDADDLRCSHGATVGQLDEEALFYLRSRGLGERAARALLIRGFAADILEHVAPPALRERLGQRVLAWLPGEATS